MLRWIVVLGLALAPAAAAAARRAPVPGTDLVLTLDRGGQLWVGRGNVRARVSVDTDLPLDLPYPDFFLEVAATSTPPAVTVRLEASCLGWQTRAIAPARLEALLENAAAEALFRAKRWDEAAAGFTRARARDPALLEASTNLAAAQARGGHAPEAIATLAAAAARDPIWATWRLAADPDLASLAAAPALAELHGTPAGAPPRALDGRQVAFSPGRGLYAWRRSLVNGMCDEDDCRTDQLWIADAATATVRARLDYGRGRAGAAAIGRTLDALGFTVRAPIRRLGGNDGADPDQSSAVAFREQGLTVSLAGSVARLTRDKQVIAQVRFDKPKGTEVPNADTSWTDPWAALIPGAVVVGAGVAIAEGCGAFEYDEVRLLLLPPAAPR